MLFERPIVVVDFDGTLVDNSKADYPAIGPVLEGAVDWLYSVATIYTLWVVSARASDPTQVIRIINTLSDAGFMGVPYRVSNEKPPAVMYVDDLGWLVTGPGSWPTVEQIGAFRPWNKPDSFDPLFADDHVIASAEDAAATLARVAEVVEPYLTTVMEGVAASVGAPLVGRQHVLKAESSLRGKVDALISNEGVTVSEAADRVYDAVRYTLVFDDADYADGVRATLAELERQGFSLVRLRNYWADGVNTDDVASGTYVGVNAVMQTKDGFPFELQFHTAASYFDQQSNWDGYRALRQGLEGDEADAVVERMRASASQVPRPAGVQALESINASGGICAPATPLYGSEPLVYADDWDGAGIPASVHYRPAEEEGVCCGECSWFDPAGRCRMFDEANVDPSYVCDEWEDADATLAAAARPLVAAGEPKPVSVRHHNAVLKAGEARALELEPKLVDLLVPLFRQAGEVAAAAFEAKATAAVTASARRRADLDALGRAGLHSEAREMLLSLALRASSAAADVTGASTMICVKPRLSEAETLDPDNPEILHVTLAYLGETGEADLQAIVDAVAPVAGSLAPLSGIVGGRGVFGDDAGLQPIILLPDVPGLVELRVAVTEALVQAEVEYKREHGFLAHITVDYADEGETPTLPPQDEPGSPLHFDAIEVVRGDKVIASLPLVGASSLTAAGGPGFCLPAALRAKINPVREAVIKTVAQTSVEGVGISFDVTNPYIGKALAATSKHIGFISKTTQRDVMSAIKQSYEGGLSIRDTATAIRTALGETAVDRATMIARTELAGAVNAGSLAATQIVSDATGTTYYKQWLTAEGARYPRHETYEDLDGQTKQLDDYFDVGSSQLQHPGDPDGDPGEVCNCRCTMTYTEDVADLTASVKPRPGIRLSILGVLEQQIRDFEADVGALTAASPAKWLGPAADELLSVDCETPAGAVQAIVANKPVNVYLPDRLNAEIRKSVAQSILNGDTSPETASLLEALYKVPEVATRSDGKVKVAITPSHMQLIHDRLDDLILRWEKNGDTALVKQGEKLQESLRPLGSASKVNTSRTVAKPVSAALPKTPITDKPLTARLRSTGSKAKLEKVNQAFFPTNDAGYLQAGSAAKDRVMKRLASRLADNPDWNPEASLRVYHDPLASTRRQGSQDESAVSGLISSWATTSGDSSPPALFLQDMAAREFGLSAKSSYDLTPSVRKQLDVLRGSDALVQSTRAFLRTMYEETQAEFQRIGVNEVDVVRGMSVDKIDLQPGESLIKANPMSSWSTSQSIADGFSTEYGESGSRSIVLHATVPVERIIGSPQTGFGCLSEYEFVVLGQSPSAVTADAAFVEAAPVSSHELSDVLDDPDYVRWFEDNGFLEWSANQPLSKDIGDLLNEFETQMKAKGVVYVDEEAWSWATEDAVTSLGDEGYDYRHAAQWFTDHKAQLGPENPTTNQLVSAYKKSGDAKMYEPEKTAVPPKAAAQPVKPSGKLKLNPKGSLDETPQHAPDSAAASKAIDKAESDINELFVVSASDNAKVTSFFQKYGAALYGYSADEIVSAFESFFYDGIPPFI